MKFFSRLIKEILFPNLIQLSNQIYFKLTFPLVLHILIDDIFLLNIDSILVNVEKEQNSLNKEIFIKNPSFIFQAAQKSDVIVAVVGETQGMTGEASSRSDISLPACQQLLLQALFNTEKPVIIVLMNGRPLTLTFEDQYATAILETWFAGTETGNAIAEVLFGYYNPAGKLTVTFPRSVGQIPLYYNHKNTGRPHNSNIPNDPFYSFGYGLSYTSFYFGQLNINKNELHGDSDRLIIHFNLTNNGSYDGEQVIQLYIADPIASITRAIKELKDFQKIFIQSEQTQLISFIITTDYLKFFDSSLNYIWEEGILNIYIGSDSVNTQSIQINWFK